MLPRACAGIYETIRFIPALNVSQQELELGLEIVDRSIKETMKEYFVEKEIAPQPARKLPFAVPTEDNYRNAVMRA